MELFPHQVKALNDTQKYNRVEIKGYEGLYEIDKKGNVYSCLSNRSRRKGILKPCVRNTGGYLYVNLYDLHGKPHKHYLHRLVAQSFIPNPNNLLEVNHIDGDKSNNSVGNLEWCTSRENTRHAYKKGLQIPKYKLSSEQITEIRKLYIPKSKEFGTVALAKKFNVCQATIYKIVKNLTYKEGDKFEVI